MICPICQCKIGRKANQKKVHGTTIHKKCPKVHGYLGNYVLVDGRKIPIEHTHKIRQSATFPVGNINMMTANEVLGTP